MKRAKPAYDLGIGRGGVNILVRFLCCIYGVPSRIISATPDGLGMAALIGASICLTTLGEFCSGTYAAWSVFRGDPSARILSISGGLLWASTIFIVDSGLVRSVSKLSAGQWRPLAARLVISIGIALTMSTPLELRIQKPLLDAANRADERATLVHESEENAAHERLQSRVDEAKRAEEARATQQQRLGGEPDSLDYKEASAASKASRERYAAIVNRDAPRILKLQREADNTEDEVRRRELQISIRALQAEISSASKEKEAARTRMAEAGRAWGNAESAKLERLTTVAQNATEANSKASNRTQERDEQSETILKALFQNTLVREFIVSERIKWGPRTKDRAAIWEISAALTAVMMLVTCAPILVKWWADPTPLDHMMSTHRIVETQRINLLAASRVAALQAWAEVREKAIERLRDDKLRTIAAPGTTSEELEEIVKEAEDELVA